MVERVDTTYAVGQLFEIARVATVGVATGLVGRQNQSAVRHNGAIGRAILNNPKIIIADEPTGNLDTKSSYEIMDIFKKMNESGKTVVMVTHEPDIAEQTKRILVMRDGQLVSDERSGGKTDYAAIELQHMRYGTQS